MPHTNFKRQPLAVAVGLAVAGGLGQTAAAQDSGEVRLEEVTVTAQKREENLQDTPIAITTLDTMQLEEIDARSLDDLNGYVPAFSVAPFPADAAAPVVFIRGMGSVDVQSTKDQAVGIYLDGVNLARSTGLALDIADLERIEVLRGPQGTLYGRNTTGGAINYVTRKPHDELSAKVRLTGGNYNRAGFLGDVNVPITDNFFIKGAYMRDRQDGWVENNNVNNRPDQIDPWEHDNKAANLALRWHITDSFTLDLSGDYSGMEYGNGYYQNLQKTEVGSGNPPYENVIDFNPNAVVSDDRLDEASFANGFSPSTAKTRGVNLTLNWDLARVTIRSITGYRKLDGDIFQNYADGLVYARGPGYDYGPDSQDRTPGSEFIQQNQVEQSQFSQEFQAIGNAFDDSLHYVLGLYYFKEEADEDQVSTFGIPEGQRLSEVQNPLDATKFLETWAAESESESRAIYGQGTWRPNALAQRLGLTLGLRYTQDERKSSKTWVDADIIPPTGPITPGYSESADRDFSNTSGNVVVDYAFTDNVNGYGKYSTGYRAGGFSTRALPGFFSEGYDPEEVQSFELGVKSKLWEQRILLNAAAYYNNYDDLQVTAFIPPTYNNVINAGDATIKGGEIEFVGRFSRGWTVDAFYAYIDAEYGEYILNGVDQSDVKKVPQAPRHQAKLGAEYAFPMTSIGQVTARLDYLWTDEFWSNPDSINRNDSYGVLNGRIQWLDIPLPAGAIRVALWGKNLTDEEYTVLTTDFSGGDANPSPNRTITAQYGQPRTYGLDFIYEY